MSIEQHPLMSLQLQLEKEMVESGIERFTEQENKKGLKGEEADTKGARYIIRALIEPFEKAIKAFMAEASNGKPGRKHSTLPLFKGHKPAALAYLTLREGVNAVTGLERPTVQSTARCVARAVANEKHLRELSKGNPDLFHIIRSEAEAHSGSKMRDKVAAGMLRKGTEQEPLTAREEVALGTKLLDLAIEATGVFAVTRGMGRGGHDQTFLSLTPEALERIAQTRGVFSLLSPVHLPYVVPPRPWTTPTTGASWSGAFNRMHLVRTRDRAVLSLLKAASLEAVYEAVNAVQSTAWRVNARVLAVMQEAFDSEQDIAGMPERAPVPPPFPASAELASDALKRLRGGERKLEKGLDLTRLLTPAELVSLQVLKDWKKVTARCYTRGRKNTAKRLTIRRTLDLAARFAEHEAIYFPHSMDFRGRLYPFCVALSPQGSDTAKAVLTFAHGKPIGDTTGPGWLAIHGANTYGYDKARLEDRVSWAEDHSDIAREIAADPWASPGLELWTKADKPWQFLAWCFEWAGYLAEGPAFVSSLPVAMDGSCNGLQHYSAALRDSVGGAEVNLVPRADAADIYATVARLSVEKVTAFLCGQRFQTGTLGDMAALLEFWKEHGIDPMEMGKQWLAFGIDRKITKRAVMTLPYGSTRFSCREFIEEAIIEKLEKGVANPWRAESDQVDNGTFRASLFLQPFVWQSISETVPAARRGMEFLQRCSAVATEENVPLHWTTPDGFVVRQANRAHKTHRIKTILAGALVKLTVREDTSDEPLDKRLQSQAVAPNWVHSMDAAALRGYVRLALDHGINSFALVHDSYGAVAADVDMMLACLKEAFIGLYADQDPLAEFRTDILMELEDHRIPDLPALPGRGNLDLELLRQSDFFFA